MECGFGIGIENIDSIEKYIPLVITVADHLHTGIRPLDNVSTMYP